MKHFLIFLACLALALYALMLSVPLAPEGAMTLVALALLAFGVQLAMLRVARSFSLFGRDLSILFWLGALALLVRLVVLIGSDDSQALSPEAYRYVWEGKMVVDGYNPYTVTPFDIGGPGLDHGALHSEVSAPHLPATHPPLAEWLFALAYILHHDSIHGFRLLSFVFELLTLLAVVVLIVPEIQKRPFQSWSVLIYAFSPAIILPFLLSSHLDILAAPFFIFSLIFLRRNHAASAGILLALAALVETFPLIFAPVMLFHLVGRDRIRFLLGFGSTLLLFHLPFLPGAGLDAVTASFTPVLTQPINSLAYLAFTALLGDPGDALLLAGILLALTVAVAAIPLRSRLPQVSRRIFLVGVVALLLSPTIYPEHMVWLLPFIVLRRSIPFLVFSGSILLAYYPLLAALPGHTPIVPWWLTLLIYLPLLWMVTQRSGHLVLGKVVAGANKKGPVIDRPL